MEIPGLGEVTRDVRVKTWWRSAPRPIPALFGKVATVLVDGYEDDPSKADFHATIARFLACPASALRAAEEAIFLYYRDVAEAVDEEDMPAIASPSDIWAHIQLGSEPIVTRRAYRDRGVFVSLECNCDWDPEHGLQIVFRDGERVCKIGPYDGLLTNADAWDDETLEDVVYRRMTS